MAENQKCAHPACNCMAAKDSKYCSTYCHDAGNTLELACNCGHPGCSGELARSE
jgi:metallothionein